MGNTDLDMGRIDPLVGSCWVGSDPTAWVCVGHLEWMIQNVTLDVIIVKLTFSEWLILLTFEFRYVHCAYTGNQYFIESKLFIGLLLPFFPHKLNIHE